MGLTTDELAEILMNSYTFEGVKYRIKELQKKKAETPVKESRPVCNHKNCTYEVGSRWNCEY